MFTQTSKQFNLKRKKVLAWKRWSYNFNVVNQGINELFRGEIHFFSPYFCDLERAQKYDAHLDQKHFVKTWNDGTVNWKPFTLVKLFIQNKSLEL